MERGNCRSDEDPMRNALDQCFKKSDTLINALHRRAALSHAVLFEDASAHYGSIGGKPTALQLEVIRRTLVTMPEGAEIVAAMDADPAGRELADVIESVFGRSGRTDLTFRRDEPVGAKDWNDLLRAQRQNPHCPFTRRSRASRNFAAGPRQSRPTISVYLVCPRIHCWTSI